MISKSFDMLPFWHVTVKFCIIEVGEFLDYSSVFMPKTSM